MNVVRGDEKTPSAQQHLHCSQLKSYILSRAENTKEGTLAIIGSFSFTSLTSKSRKENPQKLTQLSSS